MGHVEWTEFARVERMPAAGEIVHAEGVLQEPAGGGAVVARQLALLCGRCELFTALGRDDLGARAERRLAELGVDVHAVRAGSTRRAWVHVDDTGERTITVLGDKLLPHGPLPLDGYDAAVFVAGDVEALRSSRRARFLAATPRELATLGEGAVPLDLLVGSANDPAERYDGSLDAALVVRTEGPRGVDAGGTHFSAPAPPGPAVDSYGAGDSFAAALCFALARGDELEAAMALALRAGASVVTAMGPYEKQLRL